MYGRSYAPDYVTFGKLICDKPVIKIGSKSLTLNLSDVVKGILMESKLLLRLS